ncbi:MAG: M3 family oligoendopeptidase [Anaerolineae bacterium]|nr:M3 family oligoendopeptidase [Thermoflexales bacterium]MDW8407874.1 M3 family oligoendopeptidase [Anaerolineae bacterium]
MWIERGAHGLGPETPQGSASEAKSAAGIAWDLSELFAAPDDPALEQVFRQTAASAEAFAERYRGTIHTPSGVAPAHLLTALREAEALQEEMARLSAYASLLFAADTTQESHRALMQRVEEHMTALRNRLLFFDLEWLDVPDAHAHALIADPLLAPYRHYLSSERRFKPHTLSEAEERLMNDKDLTGINAWRRFFTEFSAAQRFTAQINGQTRELNQSQALALLRDADRATRQAAFESFYDGLRQDSHVLAFVYDTRFHDHLVTARLRNYSDPMAPRHLANEIDAQAVETMMSVVERNYPLAHRYFALKAELLGLPKLELYDQYAPLFESKEKIAFTDARQMILTALRRFSPAFADIAARFFDERWIDADPRNGKRGGAFCAGVSPAVHPYILCNYNDDLRDVMTVAHELGHGIHFYLSRKQTLFNFYMSLPVAETASVFAEMLVFDDLLAGLGDPRKRLALIAAKLEDSFATLFRQTVLTRFEQLVYQARANGRLSGAQIGELWLKANAPYYGDAVRLTPGYEWGWSYIPHFINTPFYCYAYAFGELLVLALYGKYRRQAAAFVPHYTALLESGGSLSPAEQLALVGVDIHDAGFWQIGFDELHRLIDQAEQLARAVRPTAQ